jgi:hypothetical protein
MRLLLLLLCSRWWINQAKGRAVGRIALMVIVPAYDPIGYPRSAYLRMSRLYLRVLSPRNAVSPVAPPVAVQ